MHFRLTITGLDTAPLSHFQCRPATMTVIGDGRHRATVAAGRPGYRPLLTSANGSKEEVDAAILATGYRPDPAFLAALGALDETGWPRHHDGAPGVHPRLAHVGLERQRSLSSASSRGVRHDTRRMARRPARDLRQL